MCLRDHQAFALIPDATNALLTSRRPYKEAFSNETAYEMIREGRGKHFDPKIVDVFFDNIIEVKEIQESFRKEPILKSLAS